MKKTVYMLVLFVSCLTFASCSLFTTSLGKSFARDPSAMLENATTSDLIELAKGSESANPDVAAGILNELSKKDKTEIIELSTEDKQDVLKLAVDATISMGTISGALDSVDMENLENIDADEVIGNLVDSITEFDTAIIDTLFTDPKTLATADPSVLADAAIVSLIQVVGKDGITKLMEDGGDIDFSSSKPEVIAESILSAADISDDEKAEKKDSLKATANVIKLLTGKEVTVGDETVTRDDELADIKILGLVSLGDFGF